MPNKDKNIPKRRFKAFENADAWEQRKLGEVSSHRGGTAIENYFSEDGKYKVISIGSYGLDNKYVDQNIRAVENEVTCLRVVNKNELTMVLNDKTANGNIIGRCLLIEADDEFVINQRTEIISFNSVIYPKFAYVVLNGAFREQVKKIVQGGTQIYVNYSSVEQLSFSLPTLPEQEAIGTFFSTLDSQITLHQRKLDKLKSVKQAYLSEMFPAEGERVPKRRFPGFTDAWELRKLGEVADIIGGGTPSTSNSEFWDGDIDWYTPAEIGEQIYVDGSERKITQLGLDKSSATLLPANKTILFTSRAGIGKTAILRSDATTNQGFQSIVVDNNTEPYFIFSMTDKIKNKAISVASGSTFAEISSRALGQLEFMFPSINEQKAIGTFFSTLDQHITLHQRKSI